MNNNNDVIVNNQYKANEISKSFLSLQEDKSFFEKINIIQQKALEEYKQCFEIYKTAILPHKINDIYNKIDVLQNKHDELFDRLNKQYHKIKNLSKENGLGEHINGLGYYVDIKNKDVIKTFPQELKDYRKMECDIDKIKQDKKLLQEKIKQLSIVNIDYFNILDYINDKSFIDKINFKLSEKLILKINELNDNEKARFLCRLMPISHSYKKNKDLMKQLRLGTLYLIENNRVFTSNRDNFIERFITDIGDLNYIQFKKTCDYFVKSNSSLSVNSFLEYATRKENNIFELVKDYLK